jgi:hypothetical protein
MANYRKCEQECDDMAVVYAGDRNHNGWAGYYCADCAIWLDFQVFDKFPKGVEEIS